MENKIIKKDQDLIRNARYTLSDVAIKTLSILIAQIRVEDKDFKEYIININEFKDLTGTTSKNISDYIERMTTELLSKPFKIDEYNKLNWVTVAKYKKGENQVKFEIHRDLKPYLIGMKNNFLQYDITNILKLKSTYIIRMYEICKDRLNENKRYNNKKTKFNIEIKKIREIFEIPKSYKNNDIKRHILDKAVIQFADKTDIKISYTEVKQGRKVVSLDIVVQENSRGSSDFLSSERDFISYVRNSFINKTLLKYKDSAGKEIELAVCPEGKLYNKKEPSKAIDPKNSKMLWSTLYQYALKGKLEVFE